MTYFQNPFTAEFRGNWVLGDRQYSLTFICPGNSGRSDELVVAWNESNSYDLSGNDPDGDSKNILAIRFSMGNDFNNWTNLEIDLTDNTNANLSPTPNSSSITPVEIVKILNSNPIFSSYFIASLENNKISIKQKFSATKMKFFIVNGRAETVLRFNKRAGVAELPSYFRKHKVYGGDMDYPRDNLNSLVELEPSNSGGEGQGKDVDNAVVDEAVDSRGISLNLNSSNLREDYELLEGRASGLYTFQKITVDGNDRITQVIEYPAGSGAGTLARKIRYVYSGSNKNPSEVTEVPYVIQDSDLVNP